MEIGMAANVVGFALSVFACLAISGVSFGLIRAAAFTTGDVRGAFLVTDADAATTKARVSAGEAAGPLPLEVTIDVGLTAYAYENRRRNRKNRGKVVKPIEDMCAEPSSRSIELDDSVNEERLHEAWTDHLEYFIKGYNLQQCDICADASSGLVVTSIVAVITYLPSIFTNILRLYYSYDVNCQKTMGIVSNLFSVSLSLYTWWGYRNKCFSALFDGILFFDKDWAPVMSNDEKVALFYIDFGWGPGPGYICVIVATFLKIIDIVCHVLLTTPTITRDLQEQVDYENCPRE